MLYVLYERDGYLFSKDLRSGDLDLNFDSLATVLKRTATNLLRFNSCPRAFTSYTLSHTHTQMAAFGTRGAGYGLDAELARQREAKYDHSAEDQARVRAVFTLSTSVLRLLWSCLLR